MGTHAVVFVVRPTHANTLVLVGFCVVRHDGQLDHIGPDIVEILTNSKGSLEQLVENIKIKLDGTFIEKLTISDRYDWETTRVKTLKEHTSIGYTIEFTSEGVYIHYSDDPFDPNNHERLTLPEFRQLLEDWDELCCQWAVCESSEERQDILRELMNPKAIPEEDGENGESKHKKRRTY